MTRLKIAVESTTLANGLRVVISPERSTPVATVGVYYHIGFRLEPQGRSGFAHLFEHMMFQGSELAGKMMHIRLVNSSGGVLNGSTSYDVTNYFEAVPSNALERMLWLEADRMRALKVDEENLKNQRDVVKEEVRVNVMNQPYGGFPWLDLPPVAFRNWANAHNFYGDFADLDAATLGDVQSFFRTYYAPNNAVLLMLGDVEPEEGFRLAERYFGGIPAAALPPRADSAEPPQNEERRGEVPELFGGLPAMAIGYRAPARNTADWHAVGMLDRVLHEGRAGRMGRELVMEKKVAVDLEGGVNYPVGDLFDYDGPALLVTRMIHKPEYTAAEALAAANEVIERVKEEGVKEEELAPVKVKFRSDFYSTLEGGMGSQMPRYGLMHYLACYTLFDGKPEKINSALEGFEEVTAEEVKSAAQRYLQKEKRSVLLRVPVKKGGGE